MRSWAQRVLEPFARRRRGTAEPKTGASRPAAPSVQDLIERAAGIVDDTVSAATRAQSQRLTQAFDAVARHDQPLSLFVYHADLPPGQRIAYADVSMDVARFDHTAVLEHFIERKRAFAPAASMFLVTSPGSPLRRLAAEDVTVVELPMEIEHPMYSRALAMHAYVHSAAFAAPTAFLDSDAFLNRPLDALFNLAFDIALTYRGGSGLMPVNEGAIFVQALRRPAVRAFFDRLIATYDRVAADELVVRHYGNVRRWRGGQLTLNALAHAAAPFTPYALEQIGAAKLRFLPCDSFNYSWDYAEYPGPEQFAGRWVVHLKGARKDAIEVLRAALTLPVNPAAPPSYSLDSIAPVDYEPETPLEYGRATLGQIADHFKTDKGSIKHRYTDTYERYLLPCRGKPMELLEIGVACGASLKTWACWLGDQARITGVDIRPECAKLCANYPAVRIVIADATSWQPDGDYDVIIDDGSHVSLEIVRAFRNLWPRVRRGGYYVIEDLRCTHDPSYARNFTFPMSPDAFRREHLMAWLDQLLRRMDYEASDIEFMHAYPQMLVMRKR